MDSSNDAEVFIKDALKGSGLNYDEIVSGEASEKLTKIKLDKERLGEMKLKRHSKRELSGCAKSS